MGKYYAFHTTVKGYLHEKKAIPCEDYSGSFSVPDAAAGGQFHIAVVADGHGDTACMRSGLGSRKVVEIAKQCLTEFAESVIGEMQECKDAPDQYRGYQRITDMLDKAAVCGKDARSIAKARVPESLTNAIVSRWYAFVNEDLRQNPLSEEELGQSGRYEDEYREGRRLAHVYGTTLIAALMLPGYLLLIQQGDGRCDVFYEDGTVDQPIPWDERCHENVTTSMCDEDAPASIRSRVISLKDKKVIACYLGSDGVEDAYRDMEGTHMFYRGLTCELAERGTEGFEAYLAEMLPGFSQTGSGDDVSVSGIVDMEYIREFVPVFRMKIRQYDLKDELNRYENRIISMSRKHGILRELVEEAEKEYGQVKKQSDMAEAEYIKASGMYAEAATKAGECRKQRIEWENELNQLVDERRKSVQNHLEESWGGVQYSVGGRLTGEKREFSNPSANKGILDRKIEEIKYLIKKFLPQYNKACSDETILNDKVSETRQKINSIRPSLDELDKKRVKAWQEFNEYDQEYQSIKTQIERINREINDIGRKNVPVPQEEKKDAAPECRGAELLSDGQDSDRDASVETEGQDGAECPVREGETYDNQCECDTGKVQDGQGTVRNEGGGVRQGLDSDMGI